jgi:endoglucanase
MAAETNRRMFINTLGAAAAAAALPRVVFGAETQTSKPAQTAIPRWRGFNLLNFFQAMSRGEESNGDVPENDWKWIRDWGFDFVRLPLDYWLWIDSDWRRTRKLLPEEMLKIKPSALEKIDRAVDMGRKYSIHVNLNLHRAPGYCINDPQREPLVLWKDRQAEDAFVDHWDMFAKRYKGVPAKDLSFNLVNEAPSPRQGYMTREDYRRVMTRATEIIRETSPDRLVIIDGLSVGNEVVSEMIPTKVAQSVHAYRPAEISHFRASWVDHNSTFPVPTWPLKNKDGSIKLDRAGLEKMYAPWAELARKGVGVHCGEGGAFNRTPYPVFIAWMEDVMDILKGHGIGYALWNFRGGFGILDSGRRDIAYEDWHGHKLDRKLLSLLQKY